MLYLSTSASHSHGNGNSPIPLHNHHTPVSVQAHIITKCCFRAIIIIIMFYYAIMTARHTVQYTYTHTVIHANASTKTQKKILKTVKTVKRDRTGKTRATLGLLYCAGECVPYSMAENLSEIGEAFCCIPEHLGVLCLTERTGRNSLFKI